MTRNKLITALSIIYIISGFANICIFLYFASLPTGPTFDLTSIIGGILALYIGFQLLQLHEVGRKLALLFLYVHVVIYALFSVWSLFNIQNTKDKFVIAGLSFRGKLIYPMANPYVVPGLWLVFIILTLLIIAFLSQTKTMQLFRQQESSSITSEPINGSMQK